MSQIIQHRRGSLGNIKSLNTNGPIHRGEILVATGSLYISSGSSDSDNYHLSASIFFGGSLTPSGNEYKALTQVISGSGLPSVTTGTYGRSLDGILYINTDDNKLYRLVAEVDANPATSGNFTGSHQLISGGGGGGGSSDYPSIGTPDDGTYTDGVFPFTSTTTIANAIDQINEVLKVIAPSSPPNYQGLSFAASGTITGKLSFGDNHAISGYTNVGDNIGQTYGGSDYASIQTVVFATSSDVPSVVASDNTGGFKGIYGDPSSTTGTVNDIATRLGKGNPAVSAGSNGSYVQYAVGDGKIGVMALYLNGARFLTASLSGSDAAGVAQIQDTTSNGSNLTLSATQSVFFSDGIAKLEGAEYRTFTYSIATADMRNGHNYLTVRHELAGSTRTATKHDWIHDNFSGTMAATDNATHPITSSLSAAQGFDTSKVHSVSGIKFYTPGFGASLVQAYTSSFTGIYQNVYPSATSAITMGSNNMTIDSSTKKIEGSKISTLTGASANKFPDLDIANHPTTTEDSNMTMSFAATVDITDTGVFHAPGSGTTNAACSFGFSSAVTPLMRSGLSAPSITNENRYYYNSITSGSTSEAYIETFRGEIYRQAYSANSIGSTSNTWNGTTDLSNSTAGAVQAVQFQTKLIDIKSAGNSGVFTTFHGPSGQPTYSAGNVASGDRSYVRYFKAPFASGYNEFAIEFVGSGKIVPDGSSLFQADDEYFKVQVMRGTTANGAGAGVANAWADPVGNGTFSRLNTLNTSNHYVPLASSTSNISYTENVTLSGGTTVPTGVIPWKDNAGGVVSANDIIGIHIILPEGFTGNIDAIAFNYTNVTSGNDGNSVTVPILQNVSSGNL